MFTAASVRAQGVQVLIRYRHPAQAQPAVQGGQDEDDQDEQEDQAEERMRENLASSEELLAGVLAPPLTFQQQRGPGGKIIERRYCADWVGGLSEEEKQRALARLRELWGEDISIIEEEGRKAPAQDKERSSGEKRRDAQDRLHAELDGADARFEEHANAAQALAAAPQGFFDGAHRYDAVSGAEPAWSSHGQPLSIAGLNARARGRNTLAVMGGGLHVAQVPPPPGKDGGGGRYEDIIREEAGSAGLEPAALRSLLAAKGGLSARPDRVSRGAQGLLLITPAAAEQVGLAGEDLRDARGNIRVGANLFASLLKRFDGDVHRALAAFQVGEARVIRSGGIPNDPAVKALLAAYEREYRQGSDDEPEVRPVAPRQESMLDRAAALAEKAEAKVEEFVQDRPGPERIKRLYRKMIEVVCRPHNVDPRLIEAMMVAENPWGDPMRISPEGAVGLMQFTPATARRWHIDPRNPEQSVDGAARYLKYFLDVFDGDIVLAVAAYNVGEKPVLRAGRVPRNKETPGYVRRVFAVYNDIGEESVDYAAYLPSSARRVASRRRS